MKKILKQISISRLIFSIVFSIALFFMSKIRFYEYVTQNNYMEKIFLNEFLILFLIIPIVYGILYIIEEKYKKIIDIIIKKEENVDKKKFCVLTFLFLFGIYILYYLTFYPGGVYVDTWTSLRMLFGIDEFTSQQPVIYTLCLNIVKMFGENIYAGFGLFTFIQIVLMVTIFTYFAYWLLNKKVNSKVVILIVAFLGFFKLYPLYSVSVWKDTPFSLAMFLYTLNIIDLFLDIQNKNIKKINIIKCSIYTLLIWLFRTNGKYVCLIMYAILLLFYIVNFIKKYSIKGITILFIASTITIAIAMIIEGLYPYFGITAKGSGIGDSIAIPIQQVARVAVAEGNITDEQLELVEKVIPIEILKKEYRATLVDFVKWNAEFDKEYLENHLGEYLKLWFDLLLKNPGEYFKAYLLQTSGYWTFNVKGPEAFHSATTWPTLEEIQTIDLINQVTAFSFKDDFLKLPYYSGGFFFWIMILSMFITFKNCNVKYLFIYLPNVLLWLSVMASTPMASALRYVYSLVLILPLNIIYPAIAKKDENSEIS